MARFFRRGISKVYFLPAVAGTSPTRPEITAGENLSPFVAEINGFELSNSPIATPNLEDRFTPQIPGEDTVADSSLVFNDDDEDDTVRTLLAKGETGFLVFFPYGDVPTKRAEVWPVTSTGFNDQYTTGNDPARAAAGFAVTEVPEQDAVVPAA